MFLNCCHINKIGGIVLEDEETVEESNSEQDNEEVTAQELEDCINQKMRAIADYQNLKRRVDEERKERQRKITSDVIYTMLPVLDDIDRALISTQVTAITENDNGVQEKWVEGILLIKEKFMNILNDEGIIEIDTKVDFDPKLHEAVGYANGNENKILEVIQKGFCMDDVIIRPAKVVVGQKKKKEN